MSVDAYQLPMTDGFLRDTIVPFLQRQRRHRRLVIGAESLHRRLRSLGLVGVFCATTTTTRTTTTATPITPITIRQLLRACQHSSIPVVFVPMTSKQLARLVHGSADTVGAVGVTVEAADPSWDAILKHTRLLQTQFQQHWIVHSKAHPPHSSSSSIEGHPLWQAVHSAYPVAMVQKWLDSVKPGGYRDAPVHPSDGSTLLMRALQLHEEPPVLVQLLLAHTSTSMLCSMRNFRGESVLHVAACQGTLGMLALVLEACLPVLQLLVDRRDFNGNTALMAVVSQKQQQVDAKERVQLLLRFNASTSGALELACRMGRPSMLKQLLTNNPNITANDFYKQKEQRDATEDNSRTLLMAACQSGHWATVHWLTGYAQRQLEDPQEFSAYLHRTDSQGRDCFWYAVNHSDSSSAVERDRIVAYLQRKRSRFNPSHSEYQDA